MMPSRFESKQIDADVDGLVVEQDAHLGPLGDRLADLWLLLDEIADRLRLLPRGLVEHAVDAIGDDTLSACSVFVGGLPGLRFRAREMPPRAATPSTTSQRQAST